MLVPRTNIDAIHFYAPNNIPLYTDLPKNILPYSLEFNLISTSGELTDKTPTIDVNSSPLPGKNPVSSEISSEISSKI